MASKNTIALFLTINLVLFGFTVSQTPTCPRDIEACSDIFGLGSIINSQTVRPCCDLVAGLDATVASVCICDATKLVGLSYSFTVGLAKDSFPLPGRLSTTWFQM
ncbi:PREDICTED: putative lipid-binding protein AIR1B [Camelina sativa]|uniref:Lipid-binding protein AIR1B n=1 Tax=Camelina sativa TaxID=90675 RepID=A0ABM0U649_CAMSA|nr:PREDICTED: putative lipid-binding protein AIR1B [Camelina sativa]